MRKSSMRKNSLICLLLGLLTLCHHRMARGEEVHQLEPIIITADRIPQPITKSTSSVTLITQEELDKQSPARIEEILRGTPGISTNSSGTMGEIVTIRLRGGNSNQTLVLIDGMKVNSPWDGAYGEWSNTGLADIGRIEIIRGTQSELYGSEAIGGVVHLFTKGGKDAHGTTLSLGGGNFETSKESLESAGGGKIGQYFFSANQTNSQGQFDNDDAYRNTSFTARVDWQPSQAFSIKTICRYRDAQKELAVNSGGSNPADPKQIVFFWDDKGIQRDHFSQQTMSIEGIPLDYWHYRLNFGALQDHYRTEKGSNANSAALSITDVLSDRLVAGTQHDFSWTDLPNTFSIGLEYEREAADGRSEKEQAGKPSTRKVIDKSSNQLSLFFQDRFEFHPFISTAGLRWDNNSAYGDVLSPRISGSIDIDQTKTRLKSSWAEGFRAPTFKELYYPDLGNPDLNPEKNTSFEIGVEQPLLDTLSIGCTYFHTSFKDLIARTPTGIYNIGKARAEGIEGELDYTPLQELSFQVSYTYLDTKDKESNHEIPEQPHHTWKVAADYSKGRFSVHPVIYMVSSEYSLAYPPPPYSYLDLHGNQIKERNPGYTRVDVAFQYEIPLHLLSKSRWQWYTRINNLLDEEYCDVQGFPAPGVNFLTGITGTF